MIATEKVLGLIVDRFRLEFTNGLKSETMPSCVKPA